MRTGVAVVLLLVLAISLSPAGLPSSAEPPEPPSPTFSSQMWGAAGSGYTDSSGWGFTAAEITNPGPTITVSPGENVDFVLNSVDVTHRWHLDYNGNNLSDAGEPLSPFFGSSPSGTAWSFTARGTPGAFWYRCAVHLWGLQRGRFFIVGNQPPTVSITSPSATPERWTGGSDHPIAWTMSDGDDATNTLTVYVNYSYNGGANSGTIAGPSAGITSAVWNVPAVDATDARVTVDVLDPAGTKGSDSETIPIIDSTDPSVSAVDPANGATGVALNANVVVTFSETMNPATGTPPVVGLQTVTGGAWVPVTYTWDASNTELTLNPTPLLSPNTDYRLVVNGTALDASSPGNPLGAQFASTFTTGTSVDSTPPTITGVAASPATALAGRTVEISATVQDDTAVGAVRVNVSLPDGSSRNETMARGAADRFAFADAWTQVGAHNFVIWARDAAGNWASASGSFTMQGPADTTAPTINHTPPTSPVLVGSPIPLAATVTDDRQIESVHVEFTDVSAAQRTEPMALQGGQYVFTIPAQTAEGILAYRIFATDTSGNVAATQTVTLAIVAQLPPAFDPIPFLITGVLILLVVLAIALWLWMRRRRVPRPPGGPSS